MTQTTTLRLPAPLKAEAESYAASLGVSLNALCAVALRDYLDARQGGEVPAPRAAPSPVHGPKPIRAAPVVYRQPVDGVYALCPCGSGKKWKWCHGGT